MNREMCRMAPARLSRLQRRVLIVIWLSCGLPSLTWAGADEGFAAYQRGEYRTAHRLWLPLAQRGDVRAQGALGGLYADGRGVPQDYVEAVKWFRLAAAQGLAVAQYALGMLYRNGQGVPQDAAEAAQWFRLAAAQGQPKAQFMLGILSQQGEGVPQDAAEAATWYRKAAEQGEAAAQLSLGVLYADGRGVPQDLTQAHVWLTLAAARLPPGEAQDKAVKARDILAAHMTAAQLAEAQRRARVWRPTDHSATSP
jgi:TPR repeat protein